MPEKPSMSPLVAGKQPTDPQYMSASHTSKTDLMKASRTGTESLQYSESLNLSVRDEFELLRYV